MIQISFILPSILNNGKGEKKIIISGNGLTLSDAFNQLSNNMDDKFKNKVLNTDGTIRSLINIYINGKNSQFFNGMQTTLKDGDEIYILPAVAGGDLTLTDTELDRYSRQIMLDDIGYSGQLKIKHATVCVVGVGGLGIPIVTRLTAMGIGKLRIVDRDVIELSNLHRQTLFDESDIGKIKVEVAKTKLLKINNNVNIEAIATSINDYTADDIINDCDIIIDALDSVNARYSINKTCIKNNIPFVTGAAVGTSGQSFTILPKQSACYNCVFPNLVDSNMPTCSIEGVHPSILSIIGGIEVSEAIKIITGKKPELTNKILHVDLDTLSFEYAKIFRVDECSICGTGYTHLQNREKLLVEELCSRKGKRTFSITPTDKLDINIKKITAISHQNGFNIHKSDLGLSIINDVVSINLMNKGSAIITGAKNQDNALQLYDVFFAK